MKKIEIPFIYCQGAGNNFILVDEPLIADPLTNKDRKYFAISMSAKYGVDGLLFLGDSDLADGSMRMFNPNGSEAEMCGNGIRCVARLLMEKKKTSEVKIEMQSKLFSVKKTEPFISVETYEVRIDEVLQSTLSLSINLPLPHLVRSPIAEISRKRKFTALGMPNPHLIIRALPNEEEATIEQELIELGEKAQESQDIFPRGINVSVYRPFKEGIFVQTYERGVGITNSCGTAMCAASIAYAMANDLPLPAHVEVWNKGGKVLCTVWNLGIQMSVSLRGNATFHYRGTAHYDTNSSELYESRILEVFSDEIASYESLLKQIHSL